MSLNEMYKTCQVGDVFSVPDNHSYYLIKKTADNYGVNIKTRRTTFGFKVSITEIDLWLRNRKTN